MWRGARVLVLAALSLLAEPSLAAKKYNLTVGYLPALTGELRDRQGLTISGALSIALEEVNPSQFLTSKMSETFLPNYCSIYPFKRFRIVSH